MESGPGPVATKAQDTVTSLINVAESLAESALGDVSRIAKAHDSIDAVAPSRPTIAIDEFGNAWREAQRALR